MAHLPLSGCRPVFLPPYTESVPGTFSLTPIPAKYPAAPSRPYRPPLQYLLLLTGFLLRRRNSFPAPLLALRLPPGPFLLPAPLRLFDCWCPAAPPALLQLSQNLLHALLFHLPFLSSVLAHSLLAPAYSL